MSNLRDTKLRNVPDYLTKNLSKGSDHLWLGWCRIWNSYRAKYVQVKNARLTPFIHVCIAAMAINYYMEYPHIKGELVCRVWCTFLAASLYVWVVYLTVSGT